MYKSNRATQLPRASAPADEGYASEYLPKILPTEPTTLTTDRQLSIFARRPPVLNFHKVSSSRLRRRSRQAQFCRARSLSQQRIRIIQTSIQFIFQRFHSERADCIRPARLQPGIIAVHECRHSMFLVLDLGPHQPITDASTLSHSDLAIQQRHQYFTQLRLQDAIQKFQRVIVDRYVVRLQAYICAVHIKVGVYQAQQTKDTL